MKKLFLILLILPSLIFAQGNETYGKKSLWDRLTTGISPSDTTAEVRIGTRVDYGAYILQVLGDSRLRGNLDLTDGTAMFGAGTGASLTDSSLVINYTSGSPVVNWYGADGDTWNIGISASDQAIFDGASSYRFGNGFIDIIDDQRILMGTVPVLARNGGTGDVTISSNAGNIILSRNSNINGNLSFADPGTSANSYSISLVADNATTAQTGTIQVMYGADPYMRFSAPNDAGTATAILDLKDQRVVIGSSGAGVDYDIYFQGETNQGSMTYMEDEDRFDFDNDVDVIADLTAGTIQSDATVKATTMVGNVAQQTTTLGVGATTFAVTSNVITVTGDAGANTIATITGATVGLYTFVFVDALVTISNDDTHAANTIDLDGANNFTSAADKVLTLFFNGTSWYRIGESIN